MRYCSCGDYGVVYEESTHWFCLFYQSVPIPEEIYVVPAEALSEEDATTDSFAFGRQMRGSGKKPWRRIHLLLFGWKEDFTRIRNIGKTGFRYFSDEIFGALAEIESKDHIVSKLFVIQGGEAGRDNHVYRNLIDNSYEKPIDAEAAYLLEFEKSMLKKYGLS